MDTQRLPLPPEISSAIAASGGVPLQFEDPNTHERFLLVEQPPDFTLDGDYLRKMLDEAITAAEAGEAIAWNPDRVKQQGRKLLEARKAQR
jgi:hypothetical protein